MMTVIICFFIYHIGKEMGKHKRNQEILDNINKLNKKKDESN